MNLYKIGEVSKICNISPASIRFFEEKGILTPQKDVVNNYRYYTVWDINRLLEYRKYRDMGFSLNEAIDILKNGDLMDFSRIISEKQAEAERMAHYYEMKAVKLRNHNNAIRKAQISVGSYSVVNSPAYYYCLNRFFDGKTYQFLKPEETDHAISTLLENYEFVENIYRIEKKWFDTKENVPQFQWGLAMKKQWAEAMEISLDSNITYAPSVKAVHTFVRTTDRIPFSPEMFYPALDYMKSNDYKLAGDILGIWIATIQEEGHESRYMEVWIPIE